MIRGSFLKSPCCDLHADALIENDDNAEHMALCGRLLVGLEALKTVLKEQLPAHLIKRLMVDIAEEDHFAELYPTGGIPFFTFSRQRI